MKDSFFTCLFLFILIFALHACSSDEEDLLQAVRDENFSKVEYLIQRDLDFNAKDQYGMTALHILAMKGKTGLVK